MSLTTKTTSDKVHYIHHGVLGYVATEEGYAGARLEIYEIEVKTPKRTGRTFKYGGGFMESLGWVALAKLGYQRDLIFLYIYMTYSPNPGTTIFLTPFCNIFS